MTESTTQRVDSRQDDIAACNETIATSRRYFKLALRITIVFIAVTLITGMAPFFSDVTILRLRTSIAIYLIVAIGLMLKYRIDYHAAEQRKLTIQYDLKNFPDVPPPASRRYLIGEEHE